MHYYQHNIGDYLRDTAHLSVIEHGVYRLLLDWCYLNEAPISTEKALRLGRGYPNETQSVLSEFFLQTEIGWEHKRVALEVAAYKAKSLKNKQNGQKGGRPRTENNPVGCQSVSELEAKQTLTKNQEPITNNQEPIEEISKLSLASTRPVAESEPKPEQAIPVKPAIPDCPHLEILSLWAEVLPALPRHSPSLWNGARAAHLRARWRETAAVKGWTNKEQGLAYFRRVFTFVGNSKFLTGRVPNRDPTRRPMLIELEWLVSPRNWAKVLEGKYNEEVAAA